MSTTAVTPTIDARSVRGIPLSYRALKRCNFDGVIFEAGSVIPADTPFLKNKPQVDMCLRSRYLEVAPVDAPELTERVERVQQPESVSSPAKAKVKGKR